MSQRPALTVWSKTEIVPWIAASLDFKHLPLHWDKTTWTNFPPRSIQFYLLSLSIITSLLITSVISRMLFSRYENLHSVAPIWAQTQSDGCDCSSHMCILVFVLHTCHSCNPEKYLILEENVYFWACLQSAAVSNNLWPEDISCYFLNDARSFWGNKT